MNSTQKKIVAISVPVLALFLGAYVLSPPDSGLFALNYYFHSYGIHWFFLVTLISVFEFFWWKFPSVKIDKKGLFRAYYISGGLGLFWILVGLIYPGDYTGRCDGAVATKLISLGISLIILPWVFHGLWFYVKLFTRWISKGSTGSLQNSIDQQLPNQGLEKNKEPPPLPEGYSTQPDKENPAGDTQ